MRQPDDQFRHGRRHPHLYGRGHRLAVLQARRHDQTRRDAADGDLADGAARAGRERLVQPPGADHRRRHRVGVRDRLLHIGHLLRSRLELRIGFGTCTSGAGHVSAPTTFPFQYDATPPTVSSSPARGADSNGWYNHPVGVAFSGTDAISGVDSCSGATTYSGPDTGSASVAGTLPRQGRQQRERDLRAEVRLDAADSDRHNA